MNNIDQFRTTGGRIKLAKTEYKPSRKYVFGSHANTAHVWNSNRVESGRSADERMRFSQGVIYSYGTHFAIAMHLNTSEGEITLLNSNGYSPSTGKHKSHVWHAMSRTHYTLPDLTSIVEGLKDIANGRTPANSWNASRVVEYIQKQILDAPADTLILLARITGVQRKLCAYYRKALTARNKAKATADKRMLESQIREATNAATISDSEFLAWIEKNMGAWGAGRRETTADTFKRLATEYWRFERVAKKHLGKRAHATIQARHKSLRHDAKTWEVKLQKREALGQFGRYKGTFKTLLNSALLNGGIGAVAEMHNVETLNRLALYFHAVPRMPLATQERLLTIASAASRRHDELRREQEAKRFAEQEAERADWLAGRGLSYRRFSDENGRALLRVKGDNLETSHGANVPLAHAIKAFPLIKLCREHGRPWARNGHTMRVGHYQIDSIDTQGNFRAGCHSIGWNEVERIALALGVFTAPAADTSEDSGRH